MTTTTPAPALSTPTPLAPSERRTVAWLFAVWLAGALAVGASGLYSLERRALVPLTIASLVLAQLVAYRAEGHVLRRFADGIELRAIALFQAVRLPVGVAFLVLASHGLDATFARVAGWGDVVSGLFALGVALAAPRSRAVWWAWTLVGLGDIAVVIVTAQRILLFSDHPQTMMLLAGLPGALLPTFLVPLVVTTHLLVIARLRRAG